VKFVLVNGRTPRPQSFCALCCEPIGGSYLREIATRLSSATSVVKCRPGTSKSCAKVIMSLKLNLSSPRAERYDPPSRHAAAELASIISALPEVSNCVRGKGFGKLDAPRNLCTSKRVGGSG